MKTTALILMIALHSTIGCSDQRVAHADSGSGPRRGASVDLHPAPDIEVRLSRSEYEETLTIPAEWSGEKYHNYTFNCESANVERLIQFLHWNFEQSSPVVIGSEHIPDDLYCISFGSKKWDSKEDIVKDVVHAVETAFGVSITLQESPRTLVIKKENEK